MTDSPDPTNPTGTGAQWSKASGTDPDATGETTSGFGSSAAGVGATPRGGSRSTEQLEQRIAELEQRLERLSGGRSEETAYWAILESILPADARRHLRAAGREQLMAARSMLDAWIGRMDEQAEDQRTRRETIRVD